MQRPISFIIPIVLVWVLMAAGCHRREGLVVENLNPIANFSDGKSPLFLQMELGDAITEGIELPGKSQSGGHFVFRAEIANNFPSTQKLYYKIYYQNETYKFRENVRVWRTDSAGNPYWEYLQNRRASENFYGSWEDPKEGFREWKELGAGQREVLSDSFKIIGNPRNEELYYGPPTEEYFLTPGEMDRTLAAMRRSKEWVAALREKAKQNNLTYEEQEYRDAIWAVNHKRQSGEYNNRWKRNPRTGDYRFMLVVATEEGLTQLPKAVQQIGEKDAQTGTFINPFYYFLHSGKELPAGVAVFKSSTVVNAKAKMDLSSGLYVDNVLFGNHIIPDSCAGQGCGPTLDIFKKAQFEQYFHTVFEDLLVHNVPEAADVANTGFSRKDYVRLTERYADPNSRQADFVRITDCPCKTVAYDPQAQAIVLTNPTHQQGKRVKENVGIKGRIGFTYGKYRALIQFPPMLSEDHVWNGITNAFWLIFQGDGAWNMRDSCLNSGYIPKGMPEIEASRQARATYSEIDIEIVKTSQFWPKTSYGGAEDFPQEDPSLTRDLTLTFTNWDMTCAEPPQFGGGVRPLIHEGVQYNMHRWDKYYRALTAKTVRAHDLTVGQPIWYEIEWKPEEIIWRIGLDKEHMEVFGYMNSTVTKIPNNQMVPVVTQEYHHAGWWPLTPFKQDFIPFPLNPIQGKVLAMEVE